jgi:hypothetical protein
VDRIDDQERSSCKRAMFNGVCSLWPVKHLLPPRNSESGDFMAAIPSARTLWISAAAGTIVWLGVSAFDDIVLVDARGVPLSVDQGMANCPACGHMFQDRIDHFIRECNACNSRFRVWRDDEFRQRTKIMEYSRDERRSKRIHAASSSRG